MRAGRIAVYALDCFCVCLLQGGGGGEVQRVMPEVWLHQDLCFVRIGSGYKGIIDSDPLETVSHCSKWLSSKTQDPGHHFNKPVWEHTMGSKQYCLEEVPGLL